MKGDFHAPKNQKPTQAQLRSLIKLARWLSAAYGIPAERILGHRDQEATTCPGDNLYALLNQVRQAVAAPESPASVMASGLDSVVPRVQALPVFAELQDGPVWEQRTVP